MSEARQLDNGKWVHPLVLGQYDTMKQANDWANCRSRCTGYLTINAGAVKRWREWCKLDNPNTPADEIVKIGKRLKKRYKLNHAPQPLSP